ncbi:hypothetical protein MGYG_04576 [Nannizzia gypsea CBS 118893]|uniref:Uncharacterized protein n=1 Tax=Arthroderma gypseum (strain ATCC MYA-4604 / CBS 118893) TaxID=535722 RepID=E4UTT0_ARTGP|nr:hypothetical protein MGYG_04576 [Nannizzia gypsea CBS 118893]EFR01573.1 hypothetical protein MGYG_04576 [Nannizzia gypsea CBS 118893]
MWLFRGAQSAIFYYAACTPCTEHLQKRKRKRDAARSAREAGRDALVTDQPVFYQPTPFSTNRYWGEEIALGPGPPARRGRNNNNATSRRGSQKSLSVLEKEKPTVTERAVLTGVLEDLPISKDANNNKKSDTASSRLATRWNSVRYQRDDELLWGCDARASSSSLRVATRGSSKYSLDPPPEVHDVYPPIASALMRKEEIQWMLQPPPSAKVMEGKIRADTSSRFSASSSPLLRGVKQSPGTAGLDAGGQQHPLSRPSPAHSPGSASLMYSPTTKSRKSSTGATISRDLIPIDSLISLSNTSPSLDQQRPSLSRLSTTVRRQSSDHHQQQQLTLSPSNDSSTASPLELKPYVSLPSLQPSGTRQHRKYETEHHRPTSKETIDSGKAFRPITPSSNNTHWLRAANHSSVSKLPFASTVELGNDDNHDSDHTLDDDEFDRFDRIRTYRWSMDF